MIINNKYYTERVKKLDTAEKYITTVGLSMVDEENLDKVRNFVLKLGAEYEILFDTMWIHNDNSRLERIAEARLPEEQKGGIKK